MSAKTLLVSVSTAVDQDRAETPWLGLDSYDVSDMGFFFGRDREVVDLSQRVKSRPLTVLYGQSLFQSRRQ